MWFHEYFYHKLNTVSATFSTLPVWKKNSTPAEWIQEIASVALEFPERFARIVVIAEELNKEGIPNKTRLWDKNIPTNSEIMGVLSTAQMETWERMKGRTR